MKAAPMCHDCRRLAPLWSISGRGGANGNKAVCFACLPPEIAKLVLAEESCS